MFFDQDMTWPTLMMVAGFVLAILEIFIPSGGILGFLAGVAVLVSIVLAFMEQGPAAGFVFSLIAVVALPACLALAFRYLPYTPLGRRFLGGAPTDEEVLPDAEQREKRQELLGKIGVARSKMLPSGAIRVDNRTYDAVSQGMPIEQGEAVKVVEVYGNRIVVRPAEREEQQQQQSREGDEDLLSQPIDELGIEPIDDSLA